MMEYQNCSYYSSCNNILCIFHVLFPIYQFSVYSDIFNAYFIQIFNKKATGLSMTRLLLNISDNSRRSQAKLFAASTVSPISHRHYERLNIIVFSTKKQENQRETVQNQKSQLKTVKSK